MGFALGHIKWPMVHLALGCWGGAHVGFGWAHCMGGSVQKSIWTRVAYTNPGRELTGLALTDPGLSMGYAWAMCPAKSRTGPVLATTGLVNHGPFDVTKGCVLAKPVRESTGLALAHGYESQSAQSCPDESRLGSEGVCYLAQHASKISAPHPNRQYPKKFGSHL